MNGNFLKIIVVGDSEVGKTSLINTYYKNYYQTQIPTVGIDYKILKNIELENNQSYNIAIWDTAGQEAYRSIVKLSCSGADGAMICFDISKPDSLSAINQWIEYIRNNAPKNIVIEIVATKCDLEAKIERTEIEQLLREKLESDKMDLMYNRWSQLKQIDLQKHQQKME